MEEIISKTKMTELEILNTLERRKNVKQKSKDILNEIEIIKKDMINVNRNIEKIFEVLQTFSKKII